MLTSSVVHPPKDRARITERPRAIPRPPCVRRSRKRFMASPLLRQVDEIDGDATQCRSTASPATVRPKIEISAVIVTRGTRTPPFGCWTPVSTRLRRFRSGDSCLACSRTSGMLTATFAPEPVPMSTTVARAPLKLYGHVHALHVTPVRAEEAHAVLLDEHGLRDLAGRSCSAGSWGGRPGSPSPSPWPTVLTSETSGLPAVDGGDPEEHGRVVLSHVTGHAAGQPDHQGTRRDHADSSHGLPPELRRGRGRAHSGAHAINPCP